MGKAAVLSKFDRGQIVMARRLGTNITETARLVRCSRSADVSIHAKWINDGDTSSRQQGVCRPRVMKEKGRPRLSACRRPTRVPLLTKRHRQLRLQWAREHRDWTMDEWRRVTWWDESRFSFIKSMVVLRYAVCQANSCSPVVRQVM
ncbi:hypothetical protein AVEN_182817-1 [Araneus ventricosus]|uniref:Transposase Tc1-like domain-containing protein n=1 Tax=Araneus ventricosus TaxID=182803 RepID=A0A4Y2JS03_ARAVE|nr:hypothetical protein AVEN_182817-1 [Araneus ventricosus]